MRKKIGQYMPVLLALIAFVMLLFTAGKAAPPEETTAPTGGVPAKISAEPTSGEALAETLPPDAMAQVEQALYKYPLDETAMASCVYEGKLNEMDSTTGSGREAPAHALARLCDEQRMNPIAAFWLLVNEGLYEKRSDSSGTLPVPAFDVLKQEPKRYAYTAAGVRELLTDLLTLSGTIEDGLPMDGRLLGEDGMVDEDQIFREEGDCYYAYFVFYGERSAHFLCFYLRGGELIEDVEFQLLNLRYAAGDEDALDRIDQRGDRQAASLMAAAELLLTGQSRADQGSVAFNYELEGYDAAIERFDFNGNGETGSLTNYRIRKE